MSRGYIRGWRTGDNIEVRVLFASVDCFRDESSTFDARRFEALAGALARPSMPMVLCGSRLEDDLEQLRSALKLDHPFVLPHGEAMTVPVGYFPFPLSGGDRCGSYDVVHFGETRDQLLKSLDKAAVETGVHVEVVDRALLRFRLTGANIAALLNRIEKSGRQWAQDGELYAIRSGQDRKLPIMVLTRYFFQISRNVLSIGLGCSVEDVDLLSGVDRAVILRSRASAEVKRLVPSAYVTKAEGLAGIMEALDEFVLKQGDATEPQVA